jgi:enoyl-CoA hydratase
MTEHDGKTLSWSATGGCIELALHREPCNEIGTESLAELEQFVAALAATDTSPHALIIHSEIPAGFSAGGDLRELYHRSQEVEPSRRVVELQDFHERIHRVMNAIDSAPLTTIAAVHGWTFGGGFELALTCDLIIADKTARFCFPELRLGLLPGFGGIPRLKRDVGNAVIRDLLLTGRSFNATKAQQIGMVSQLVAKGEALRVARTTVAQLSKFDRYTVAAAKRFIKPIPVQELREEIEIVCDLFTRPAVEVALRKFVGSPDVMPYLP